MAFSISVHRIFLKDFQNHPNKTVEFQWHINSKKPELSLNKEAYSNRVVDKLFADGHELEYIRQRFYNVPVITGGGSCTWNGEMAQFIYDNL